MLHTISHNTHFPINLFNYIHSEHRQSCSQSPSTIAPPPSPLPSLLRREKSPLVTNTPWHIKSLQYYAHLFLLRPNKPVQLWEQEPWEGNIGGDTFFSSCWGVTWRPSSTSAIYVEPMYTFWWWFRLGDPAGEWVSLICWSSCRISILSRSFSPYPNTSRRCPKSSI